MNRLLHHYPPAAQTTEDSVGDLVRRASEQISQLMRQELRLAQIEMQQKSKRFGIGGGLFGGAGVVGFVALQAFAATAIVALALVWPLWLSALAVAGVLLVVAAVLAAVGKKQVRRATPPAPKQAIDSVKADMAEIREKARR